jgi:hypothetical protein
LSPVKLKPAQRTFVCAVQRKGFPQEVSPMRLRALF